LNQLQGSFKDNPDVPKRILRAIKEDRAAMQSNDAWRSFGFVVVAAGVLLAFVMNFLGWEIALTLVGVVGLIDLWAVDRRYLNNENFRTKTEYESFFSLSDAENKVAEDETRHRVANFNRDTFNDGVTSYNFASIGGYHGAKLRRYQDMIDKHFAQNTPAVYDMLNVKYILTANEAGETKAQKNPNACGNAWFVGDYEIVKDADAEINALTSLKPAEKAVIEKRFEKQVSSVGKAQEVTGKIKLTQASPDELTYETNNDKTQIAIFSEIYYAQEGKIYWQAYIDGKEVPHFRANYILRGLVVPAGKHKVTFKFHVPIYHTGETISLICSLLLLGALIGAGFVYYRQMQPQNVEV
jgi:uncharacterized membrane protein YfhO